MFIKIKIRKIIKKRKKVKNIKNNNFSSSRTSYYHRLYNLLHEIQVITY